MHNGLAFGYQFSNSCLRVCVEIAFGQYDEFGFLISCASLEILNPPYTCIFEMCFLCSKLLVICVRGNRFFIGVYDHLLQVGGISVFITVLLNCVLVVYVTF